jgi:hypothetical protein
MGLIMRPIAVESPVDKNRQDFTIFSGKWETGRIYEAQPSTPLGPNSGNLRLPIIASGLNQDAAWHGSRHAPAAPRAVKYNTE